MEMSPRQVRSASFSTARKGYDPAEVATFLDQAAEALESAQNHATAMEARARAAIAKLQELSSAEPATSTIDRSVDVAQTETISRTLLLAQRAADEAVAEAKVEAERVLEAARSQAASVGAEERERARGEVEALRARREFLQSDVEQLENFLLEQRERLRGAAADLVSVAERVPDGLGYVRPPLLSASDDPDGADAAESVRDAVRGSDFDSSADSGPDSGPDDTADAPTHDTTDDSTGADDGAPTEALPRIVLSDEHHERDDHSEHEGEAAGSGDANSADDVTPDAGQMRFVPGIDDGSAEADSADRSGDSPR